MEPPGGAARPDEETVGLPARRQSCERKLQIAGPANGGGWCTPAKGHQTTGSQAVQHWYSAQPLASIVGAWLMQTSSFRNRSRAICPSAMGMVGSLMPCDAQYAMGRSGWQVAGVVGRRPDIAATARNTLAWVQVTVFVMIPPMLKPVAKMRFSSTHSCDSNRATIAVT